MDIATENASAGDHERPLTSADLAPDEIDWLRALAHGTRVADLARESGYSERAMYRELRKLWNRLGVANRAQGLARAGELGLLVADRDQPGRSEPPPSRGGTPP